MPRYWRAYAVEAFEAYPGWTEPDAAPAVVYLDENFAIRASPTVDAPVIFESADLDWLRFCRDELAFATPDWEAEARLVRQLLKADARST